MEVKEGYKKTEVGMIPEDWEVVNLKSVITDMLQGINTAIDKPEYVSSGIPMLKANNVIDQEVLFDSADHISLKTYAKYSDRYRLKKNDFLFSNIGARLGTGSLLKINIECSFAWNVMRIVPNTKKIMPQYLSSMINSPKISSGIRSNQSGSGMGFVPKGTLEKVIFPLPPTLAEQQAIAEALSDADALIESLEQLIAKKRNIKQGAMQELLTGKRRLPGFEVKKGYKKTEVGVIPEDWEVDYIANIAHITTGGRNTQDRVESGEYPFYVRSQTIEHINCYSYNKEAILTAGDGVGTGKVFHYINGKFDAHQRVYIISDFNEYISGYFFYLYFSNYFYNRIMQMTAKSSVDSVRREMIAKMLIPLPPTLAEQQAIATILSEMDAEIAELEVKLEKARQIKQGMMQELLTGRIRLV